MYCLLFIHYSTYYISLFSLLFIVVFKIIAFFFLIYLFIFNIFIDYAITVVPFPPPLHSILPTLSLPHSPPIVHVHGSYF